MHELFDYQNQARDKASLRFREGMRSVCLVAPCGAGKTTIIADIARKAQAKSTRVIIAAHRRRLIKQLAERIQSFGVGYGVIMAELPDEPWAIVDSSASVQIASQQTLFSRRNSEGVPQTDLLIVDECHLYDQRAYTAVGNLTGYRRRLGLTATACETDGTGLGRDTWDCLEVATTIEGLIAIGRLCAVKTFGPMRLMSRRKKGQKTGKAGDPVEQWLAFAEGLRTVVFASSVAESRGVRDAYLKAGIPAAHVDAHSTDQERDAVYEATARKENLIICSVGLLKEGVDIPELECCQLLTAAVSPRVFWQGVGRIQRVCEGKDKAVLLDHSGATAIHGLPNTSPEWSLAESDSLQARERAKQESDPSARPRMCKQCGAISAGSGKCPECGSSLIVMPKAEAVTDREHLQEVTGETAKTSEDWNVIDKPNKEWQRILFITAAQGKTCAVASAMFKNKFGQWPNEVGVRPCPNMSDIKKLVKDVFPQYDRQAALA